LLLSLASSGCRSKTTYPEVSGMVTLAGRPQAGVIVKFHPEGKGSEGLPSASGKTDETGRYTLRAEKGLGGAAPGRNLVVVHWPPQPRPGNPAAHPPPPGLPIPGRYTSAAMTPLVFEVKPGGPQTIDLPLKYD
jgi:hypothetical protein